LWIITFINVSVIITMIWQNEEAVSSSKISNKIRIVIADDHPLVCIALRKVFNKNCDFEIIGEATDGEEAVRLTSELSPDVVIIDISMPKLNGLEATKKIKTQCPDTIVLILTVHSDTEHIFGVFNAGADGYLVKTAQSEEIVQAIRGLITGGTVLSPDVFKQILKRGLRYPVEKTVSHSMIDNMTAREFEILSLTAQGLSNKQIASTLNISLPTVKNYFAEIFSKLHVNSRTEAAITALRTGIIKIGGLAQDNE